MHPRLAAIVGTACFVLALSCLQDVPPSVPLVRVAGTAQPGDTLRVRVRSTDPNGGFISFFFDWGDGSAESWSAEVPAGDTLSRAHAYADTGGYLVRVRARDQEGNESEWSDGELVKVAFAGPFMPDPPQVPGTAYPDTALWFEVAAGHVREDSVSVRFDWGDGSESDWSGFVAPGETVRDSHRFDATGSYPVKARARDRAGNTSPWSLSGMLEVSQWPVERPVLRSLSTTVGTDVLLRWDRGRNRDSVYYGIWFRPIGTGEFVPVAVTAGDRAFHDPGGLTGDYTLSARFGELEFFAAETLSTIPVYSESLAFPELNVGRGGGYGWDPESGAAGVYPMDDTASAPRVDFYFTDLGPGYTGPSYWLSSPDLGPGDPGGVVPPGGWRRTWMFTLWGSGQEPLPEFDSLLYENTVFVNLVETHYALRTDDGHYAVVRTGDPDPGRGEVPVRSWFQTVPGLRLLRHSEGVGGR